jgi:hypothetical protein
MLRLKAVVTEIRTHAKGATIVLSLTAEPVATQRRADGLKASTLRFEAGSPTASRLKLAVDTPDALALFALSSVHYFDVTPAVEPVTNEAGEVVEAPPAAAPTKATRAKKAKAAK